jgi:hypothetical protein
MSRNTHSRLYGQLETRLLCNPPMSSREKALLTLQLRIDQETVERHVAEARAQLRELELQVVEKGQQAEGAEQERNGGTNLEAGAVLGGKLAALQGELMDVQVWGCILRIS